MKLDMILLINYLIVICVNVDNEQQMADNIDIPITDVDLTAAALLMTIRIIRTTAVTLTTTRTIAMTITMIIMEFQLLQVEQLRKR